MSVAQESSNQPSQIGVYRLEEEIGAGAMGKVYRATHMTLGKPVALKLVRADDPTGEVAARFLQEGIAASRVRHPNVVEILDAGRAGGIAYMAMQLLEGETLAQCLARQGRLPPTYAVDLILPVCAALVAAHEAGVLHRDLKPGNIFLNEVGRGDPEPMLLDFGISKILGPVDPELTQNPRFLGTPLYIAPEQADGAAGSPHSDQYSLALTLYETLLGVRPFARYKSSLIQLLRHVAEGNIRPPRELDASIPDELDATLCRALHVNPKARFGSVREFGAALLPFASEARRALWQSAFVDAERTMTSANSPVSDSKSSRRTQVSVESPLVSPGASQREIPPHPTTEEFLTHSSLFGEPEFDPARSSISRRFAASGDSTSAPYYQAPSNRPSGNWDSENSVPTGDRSTLDVSPAVADPASTEKKSFLRLGLVGSLALGLLGIGAAWIFLRPPDEYRVFLRVSPETARIELDGATVGSGTFEGILAANGASHRLRVTAPGHQTETYVFRDSPPPEEITLERTKSPSAEATPVVRQVSAKPDPAATLHDETINRPPADAMHSSSRPDRLVQIAPTPLPTTAGQQTPPAAPSDPAPKSVSTDQEGSSEHPGQPAPPQRPSIQTGNLDPWAQ